MQALGLCSAPGYSGEPATLTWRTRSQTSECCLLKLQLGTQAGLTPACCRPVFTSGDCHFTESVWSKFRVLPTDPGACSGAAALCALTCAAWLSQPCTQALATSGHM